MNARQETGVPRQRGDGTVPASPAARAREALARGFARVTGEVLGAHQTAVVRIGFGLTWLLFLLREWPHRDQLYGPGSTWGFGLAQRLVEDNHAFTVLLWSDSEAWFQFVYLLAVGSSVALVLGWRTRASTVLFMTGVLALQNRSVFMGDGGDNVVHLMSIYLVFTRCSRVWSLDARRARRGGGSDATGVTLWSVLGAVLAGSTAAGGFSTGWALFFWTLWVVQGGWWVLERRAPGSEARTVCGLLGNLVHHAALLVIMAEVCLVYATAGWYKVQGSRWQDGTALHYPVQLDYFSPWPALGDLLASSAVLTLVITYGTVIVQVAFPFTLLNRRAKNVLLVFMIIEHLGIAVLLGLPFFSLAMIAADLVFLPTAFLLWTGARFSRLGARLRPGGSGGDRSGGADGSGDAGRTAGADTAQAPEAEPTGRSGPAA